jgi:GAF domain-containing protein/HAMP domain-containing protein
MAMSDQEAVKLDPPDTQTAWGRRLIGVLGPLPLMAGLTAAGFVVLYGLGLAGVFEPLGWQLLAGAGILALVALAAAAILGRLRTGSGEASAYLLYAGTTCAAAVLFSLLWQGVLLGAALMAWIAPLTCIGAGIPRRRLLPSLVASATVTALAFWLAFRPAVWQLASNSTGGFAAVLLLVSMLALFALVAVTTHIIRYRTLQSRLTGSLLPIIAIPIIFTTSVSAVSAVTSNQNQLGDTLQAVASLKRGQLDTITHTILGELATIQNRSGEMTSIQNVLDRAGETDETYRLNASVAATQIRNVIVAHPASDYEEVLVLDRVGNVVLSTYLLNQGVSYADQAFFQQGLLAPTATFIRYPGQQNAAGDFKLVSAAPFYGPSQAQVLGVVVAVSSGDVVSTILGPTAGLTESTSYLVDQQYRPATSMTSPESMVRAAAITSVVSLQSGAGRSVYMNYNGTPVLGYFEWDPLLRAAVVAETPLTLLITRSLGAVLASVVVGLLTIIIAAMAVAATSRALSDPVGGLAGAAERLAGGDLGVRAQSDQEDEIGRLANSFNTMATELQSMIEDLEQRVASRTQDLESQIGRLRMAAEVARDAMLAPTLPELLERAASLITNRFGLDHVAIFLLDDQRQFAVLQAAPSATGRRMLEDRFRVRIGDPGPVGLAAGTGEVVFVDKADADRIGLGDIYNTATSSEMALPLRGSAGLMGVLDLQSRQATAFKEGDREIMRVLADQLAAAIERSRLLLQVQQRLGQVEQTYRAFSREAWGAYAQREKPAVGYRYDKVKLDPIHALPEHEGDGGKEPGGASIPIRIRDRTLGFVQVEFGQNVAPQATIEMIQEAARRLGTALENVQLLEDSIQRANKERQIGEITAKIGASINMRNILQTAAEELGRVLPGSDVTIRLGGTESVQDQDSEG